MPYNGSGTFSLTYNWATEQASSPIEIAKLDTQESDIASGLSNCILRDGTGLPSTTIPWNSQALTGVSNLSAERVTVTASTVPANGMYLSAANTVAFASNTTLRGSVNSTGAWTFAAPSAGVAMTVTGVAGTKTLQLNGATNYAWLSLVDAATSQDWSILSGLSSGNFTIRNSTSATNPLTISTAGNVTIAAPSSGKTLTVTGVTAEQAISVAGPANAAQIKFNDGTVDAYSGVGAFANTSWNFGTSSAHASTWYTGGSARVAVASAGNVTINAPSSGTALSVTGVAGGTAVSVSDGTVTGRINTATGVLQIGSFSAHGLDLFTGNTVRQQISSAGNVTINAASSGDELTVTGSVVATSFAGALTGNVTGDVTGNVSGTSGSTTGNAATATALQNARTINGTSFNGTANITVTAAADTLTGTTLAALSGVNLTALNATQLTSGTVPAARIGSSTDYAIGDGSTVNSIQIGFRGIPQNSQTVNYTCVLADAGKHILHASGGGAGDTFTIPANASVAYTIGTTITFVNADSNAVSIAITTDTLTLAGTTSTGTRTLSQNGVATAIKVGSTSWIISGSGLS